MTEIEKKIDSGKHSSGQKEGEEKLKKLHAGSKKFQAETDKEKLINQLKQQNLALKTQNIKLQGTNKKAETALKIFNAVYDSASMGYFTLDHKGIISELNHRGASMIGKNRSVLVNRNLRLFITQDTLPLFNYFLQEAIETNSKQTCEVYLSTRDNPSIFVHLEGFGSKDEQKCFVIAVDITDRKRAEEALHESQTLYSSFVESMPAGVFRKNREGRYSFVNSVFCQLKGLKAEEILGKTPDELSETDAAVPSDMMLLQRSLAVKGEEHHALIMRTGKLINLEEVYTKLDGTRQHFQVVKSPVFASNGEITGSQGILFDITERKLMEESIKEKEESYSKFINSSSDYIFLKDHIFKHLVVNISLADFYGKTPNEIIGLTDYELMPEFAANQCRKTDMETLNANSIIISEEIIGNRFFESTKFPVMLRDNKIGVGGFIRDITDRKLREEELNAARAKAEESSLLRSALLNNMNHEIRTPMNAIMGFSSLMAEADETEKISYASIIHKSGEYLLALIDDIILLSRLQSEKMPVNNIAFNPANLITEVYQMFNITDLKKNLEIKVHIPEQNLIIRSDANKIRQVLINLVSNAVKYTLAGSVLFGFELKKGFIEFFVKDTGIGIPDQDKNRIFETFFRCEKAMLLAIGGNGLGLNIAKELIDLMGGTIGVDSEPDKGSRFYFTIPFEQSNQTEPGNPSSQIVQKKLKDLTILVADDEPINFILIKSLLRRIVKRIDHALNGEEAVYLASQNRYNLVLMDMKMPVMGGIEATKILRGKYPDLPIIAQSAFTLPEDKELALHAGCNEFISKPIKKEALIEVINKYF